MGFFGGRVWVGFEAKQGQRCCAAWPLPPSKPPSLHLTISIGIRPSRNCPSRLQRILNLTMCFCSLENKKKNISAHLQSYFYILTMGSSVHHIATKSTLDKKVMILFSKVKISKNIEQNGEAHQRPQYDPRQT